MEVLNFRLVSPERILFQGEVHMVVLPGLSGDLGILVDHAPLVTVLKTGLVRIYSPQGLERQIFVAGGFAEINDIGLEVIVEEAIFVEELDAEKVDSYIQKIREEISLSQNEEDKERLRHDLQIAQAQRNVISTLTAQS